MGLQKCIYFLHFQIFALSDAVSHLYSILENVSECKKCEVYDRKPEMFYTNLEVLFQKI